MAATDEQTTADPPTGYADASIKRVTAENGDRVRVPRPRRRSMCRSSCCSTSAATSTTGIPRSSTRSPRSDGWSRSTTSASAPRPARRRTPSRRWPTTRSPSSRRWSFQRVDLLGFSIGSFVAQEIALIRPDLLRRVVLASSAPQGAAGMHGWAPEVIGAVGAPETEPAGLPRRLLRPHRARAAKPGSRPPGASSGGRQPRRADDVADPPGAVRRRLRVGHPQPLAARASRRDRAPGVRRQRRQRPDDPAALLAPAGRAPPGRADHDLPGLGPRLPLPAPQPSSPPTCTRSSRRPSRPPERPHQLWESASLAAPQRPSTSLPEYRVNPLRELARHPGARSARRSCGAGPWRFKGRRTSC